MLAPSGLAERLTQLADELTTQYVVQYARPEQLIPPEKVQVTRDPPRGDGPGQDPRGGKVMTRGRFALSVAVALAACVTIAAQTPQSPPAVPAPPSQPAPALPPPPAPPAEPAAPAPQPPAAGQPAPQQSQVFRGGVELVSLNVTVDGRAPKYVTDLNQDDFEVYEDGVKQEVTFFARGQQPIALAVLLDTSASMDERLPTAQEAAVGFAKRLKPEDAMEVIDFDSQVHILQTFTGEHERARRGDSPTTANGSTALYNAVYISLKELKKIQAENGRRDPPPGHRRPLRRRRYLEPGRVRRGAGSGEALGDGDLRDRPAADDGGAA